MQSTHLGQKATARTQYIEYNASKTLYSNPESQWTFSFGRDQASQS